MRVNVRVEVQREVLRCRERGAKGQGDMGSGTGRRDSGAGGVLVD